jgi:hypothetical protein
MSQDTATRTPASGDVRAVPGTGRRIGAAWRRLLFRAHRVRVGIDRRIGEAVVRGVAASATGVAPAGRHRLGAGSRRAGVR